MEKQPKQSNAYIAAVLFLIAAGFSGMTPGMQIPAVLFLLASIAYVIKGVKMGKSKQ